MEKLKNMVEGIGLVKMELNGCGTSAKGYPRDKAPWRKDPPRGFERFATCVYLNQSPLYEQSTSASHTPALERKPLRCSLEGPSGNEEGEANTAVGKLKRKVEKER